MESPHPQDPVQIAGPVGWRLATIGCSLVAATLAGYLAVTSIRGAGRPAGCGAGSGCDEALHSRWGTLAAIPVSAFAGGAYLLLAALAGAAPSTPHGRLRRLQMLASLAIAIVTVDFSFVAIQMCALGAVCRWCMASHVFGVAACLCSLAMARESRSAAAGSAYSPETAGPPRGYGPAMSPTPGQLLAGVVIGLGFMSVLAAWGRSNSPIGRLPRDANADTGPGPGRAIAVLQGRLQIAAHEVPVLGSPDAPRLLVMLYDYCCPHCQAAHAALRKALDRHPDSFGLILLPAPLNAHCNSSISETEPRFLDACVLARMALAVWRASPSQFDQFDRWLFESDVPRTADAARAEARRVIGPDLWPASLDDPWIDARIAADVEAFQVSQAQVLPVLLSPGASAVVGRTDEERELLQLLERDFGLSLSNE